MLRPLALAAVLFSLCLPASRSQAADCRMAVTKLLVEHLGVEKSKVLPKAKIADDLGTDNLDIVEITMAAEEQFGFDIPDDVADKIVTVDDLVKLANNNAKAGCR